MTVLFGDSAPGAYTSDSTQSRLTLADEVERCHAWRRAIEGQLGSLAPGLTMARARLLLALGTGRKTMSGAAAGLGVGVPAVSALVAKLQYQLLIAGFRTTDPASGQTYTWLELTPKGRRIVDALQR